MTRKLLVILAVLVGLMTGCAKPTTQQVTSSEWHLTIISDAESHEFSIEDIKALPFNEVQAEFKETGTLNTYKGAVLRELLKAAGADTSRLKSVDVEARDGFFASLDRELAMREDVVLAYEMDGGPLPTAMGKVRLVAVGQATKFQVKLVARITVKQ